MHANLEEPEEAGSFAASQNAAMTNMSQAPSKCLSEHKSGDRLDCLKNPLRDFKNSFCSRVTDGRTRQVAFFYDPIL